jgi:hypothetical protein
MAITFPRALPSAHYAATFDFGFLAGAGVTRSPFTGAVQTQVWPLQTWRVNVRLLPMRDAEARAWIAWLTSLNGREGTFLLGDKLRAQPQGVATGTPLVKGAAQTGATLLTDGWTSAITGILKAGDYIQLGSAASARLHMVLADVTSDGSGNATLDLWPALRESPADNAPITVRNTVGVFHMAENRNGWPAEPGAIHRMAFTAQEYL